jgi:hypothetical protein
MNKDSMVLWFGNIDTKEDFLEGFSWTIFFMDFELWFFLIKFLI